jgi:phosphoenolpyruvate carboxylase
MREGRQAYKYVTGEDKSEEATKVFKDHESKLKEAFRYFSPERFEHWFGQSKKEEMKNEK